MSGVEVLALTNGDEMHLVRAGDDGYFLLIKASGVSVSLVMSVMDAWGARSLFGDAVRERGTA